MKNPQEQGAKTPGSQIAPVPEREEESLTQEEGTRQELPETRKPQAEVAEIIADQLGETEELARKQIYFIVRALGRTQAWKLLQRTIQIEASGGMMLSDGSRRRTPGGIFFHLAYTTGKPKPGKSLHRPTYRGKNQTPVSAQQQQQTRNTPIPAKAPVAPFSWEGRIAVLNEIGTKKGTATTVKITLIGKFGKVVDKGACIVGVMQSSEKVPALPKGVPVPTATKTNYVVYIAAKQWKNVAATVEDPDDALIIEGYPQSDPKTGAISVFASQVTSKKLQAAKRQAKPA